MVYKPQVLPLPWDNSAPRPKSWGPQQAARSGPLSLSSSPCPPPSSTSSLVLPGSTSPTCSLYQILVSGPASRELNVKHKAEGIHRYSLEYGVEL